MAVKKTTAAKTTGVANSKKAAFQMLAGTINAKVFKKAAVKAEEVKSQFASVPDGDYRTKLTDVEAGKSKGGKDEQGKAKAQKPMITLTFTVIEPEKQAGSTIKKWMFIDNEDSLTYTLADLSRLGYETENLEAEEITDVLEDLLKSKPIVDLAVRTKADNKGVDRTRVYINGVMPDDGSFSGEAENAAEAASGEDEAEEVEEAEEAPKPKAGGKGGKGKKPAAAEEDDTGEEDDAGEVEEAEEEEAEEEDDDQGDLEVGSTVVFTFKGEEMEGEVVDLLEDEDDKVKIRGKNKKLYTVKVDKVEIIAD